MVVYPWNMFGVMDRLLEDVRQDISPATSIHRTATIEGAVLLDESA